MIAPFIGIERHRITTDGEGVTTLAAFAGCPLRCKFCLNPQSWNESMKPVKLSPEELYEQVKIDRLYFLATGGGVTFGGGEPLLYPEFICRFRELCGSDWNLSVETSLNVPFENLEKVMTSINHYIVDVKDMDMITYYQYTGSYNNAVIKNLQLLKNRVGADNVIVRVPHIQHYNDNVAVQQSIAQLKEMGFVHIDEFEYVIKKEDEIRWKGQLQTRNTLMGDIAAPPKKRR